MSPLGFKIRGEVLQCVARETGDGGYPEDKSSLVCFDALDAYANNSRVLIYGQEAGARDSHEEGVGRVPSGLYHPLTPRAYEAVQAGQNGEAAVGERVGGE